LQVRGADPPQQAAEPALVGVVQIRFGHQQTTPRSCRMSMERSPQTTPASDVVNLSKLEKMGEAVIAGCESRLGGMNRRCYFSPRGQTFGAA
jgi:hypothetical protein